MLTRVDVLREPVALDTQLSLQPARALNYYNHLRPVEDLARRADPPLWPGVRRPASKAGGRWILCEAAQTAKRHPQFAASYQATARRRGTKIATTAIARKLLTRAYHLLTDASSGTVSTTSRDRPPNPGVSSRFRMSRHPPRSMTSNPRPLACKDCGASGLTWPTAGERRRNVSVSDRDSPLITVRSGTPRARSAHTPRLRWQADPARRAFGPRPGSGAAAAARALCANIWS
jgi:hypothetical protein